MQVVAHHTSDHHRAGKHRLVRVFWNPGQSAEAVKGVFALPRFATVVTDYCWVGQSLFL